MSTSYYEKLKDPRWQKRRLELFSAANWTCQACGTKTETLHAHHGHYTRKTEPWDYPNEVMHVLCETCHGEMQEYMKHAHREIAMLRKCDLLLVADLLTALSKSPETRGKSLNVFHQAACAAIHFGYSIKEEEQGYGWLLHATLGASALRTYEIARELGRREGVREATSLGEVTA